MINIMIVKKVKQVRKVSSFVLKLLAMLNDQQNRPYIGWSDIPNTFVIFDTNELAKNVLPKYFKHNNLSSFIRQLNIYNFEKIKTEENEHFYHHPCFFNENKTMLKKIQRKNNYEKEKSNPDSDDSSFHINSNEEIFNHSKNNNVGTLKEIHQMRRKINHLKVQKQQQIKKVINFFTMLLKDFSSFQLDKLQEIKDVFNNAEKRKSILDKFNQNEVNMDKNYLGFVLNGDYFHRKQTTRDQSRISQEQLIVESSRKQNNVNRSQKTVRGQVRQRMMEEMIMSEDEGFLPLQENQRFEGSENMKYQKLYD